MSEYTPISDATSAKAEKVFNMLIILSDTPSEAYAIITSLMVNLWMIGAQDDADLEGLIANLAASIRTTVDMARTNDRRTAN